MGGFFFVGQDFCTHTLRHQKPVLGPHCDVAVAEGVWYPAGWSLKAVRKATHRESDCRLLFKYRRETGLLFATTPRR